MLQLMNRTRGDGEVILEAHGHIAGSDVRVLRCELIRLASAGARHVTLDLTEIRFIDQEGLALLADWSGRRFALCGASPFVAILLSEHGLTDTSADA